MKHGLLLIALLTWNAQATECVAHRGDHTSEIENSFEAVESAYHAGFTALEFDIHHTSDGVPFLMHDDNLRKTARAKAGKSCLTKVDIHTLSWEYIRNNCELKSGKEIPSLEEIINFFRAKNTQTLPTLLVELKDKPSLKTIRIFKNLLAFYPSNKVRVISFKSHYLQNLKTAMISQNIFKRIEMYHLTRSLSLNVPKYLDGMAFGRFSLNWEKVKYYFNILFQNNIKRSVWTINSESDIVEYLKLKVDYLITDRPYLCSLLKEEISSQ